MSEIYDQDLEPEKSSGLKTWFFWLVGGLLVGSLLVIVGTLIGSGNGGPGGRAACGKFSQESELGEPDG